MALEGERGRGAVSRAPAKPVTGGWKAVVGYVLAVTNRLKGRGRWNTVGPGPRPGHTSLEKLDISRLVRASSHTIIRRNASS